MLRAGTVFMVRLLLCAILLITCGAAQNRPVAASSGRDVIRGELGGSLDELLRRYMMYGFSGTVLVAGRRGIILNRGYGFADAARRLPNTVDTMFPIGSLTKQFTATAILQLETQGRLSTQDLVSRHLGEFPPDKAGITIHHLLTHTSGLISDGRNSRLPLARRDEYVEAVKHTTLRFAPGTQYAYSNVGYNLLAAIIERVSGVSFEDYIAQRLFRPAGLNHTTFVGRAPQNSTMALGYEGAIGSGRTAPTPSPQPSEWDDRGAGGVLSTTGDLYKWHRALQGTRLLSPAARAKLYTPFLNDYAYGWEVKRTSHGRRVIQHGGDVIGYQSWLASFPDDGTVLIFLINNRQGWRTPLTSTFTNAAFGQRYEMPPAVTTLDTSTLQRYIGRYELPSGGSAHAWVENGVLFVGGQGQDAVNLLIRASEQDAARYGEINARAPELIEKFRRRDFSPLQEIVEPEHLRAGYAAEFQDWWDGLVRDNGPIRTHEVLGTAPTRAGILVTFVRVEFERGAKVLRLLWRRNRLNRYGTGVPMPAIAQYLPESPTRFASFDVFTSQVARLSFDLAPDGRVTSMRLPSPNGEVLARKTE